MILAIATTMYFLPVALLGPFAGTIVDRVNRKYLMIIADLCIAAVSLLTALAILAGLTSLPIILAIVLVRSIGTTFHQPAMQAVVPLLVPDRHLVRIASLDQAILGISNIVAPALGILIYTALGLYAALLLDALGAVIACGILFFVTIPDAHMSKSERTGVIPEMLDGLRAIRACRGLGLFFIFAMFGCMAYMPMASFFPLMTFQHFSLGGYEASLIEAVFGVGFLIGSIILGVWGGGRKLFLLLDISIIGTGVFTLVSGLLPPSGFVWFAVLTFAMAVSGAFFNGPMAAMIQRKIAPEKLGRVMALLISVMSIAAPIGLLIAGPIAEITGVAVMFVVSGAALVLVAVVAFIPPSLRGLDNDLVDTPIEEGLP
jgi:DHA3 family macrolide efflux protein-like MFS transporter